MARIRTNKNICLNCFGDLDAARVCMACKKRADDTMSPLHHLPQRTILKDKDGTDRYLMGKALGEGGFGITYLAWDLIDGVKVAIKEYFPNGYVTRISKTNQVMINNKQLQSASNRGLRRFMDEAKMLAKLKNLPGVVTVRDFFSANGTAYIVMEFLDGISLKSYLKKRGNKLPVEEALRILRPVMDSLVLVHHTGLVHRDISPDNIIVTKNGTVKLIDFGAAKHANPDGKSLSIVLKQGFAPEEQYRTHGEQGPWTDIYALSVTLYFCITGMLPPESIQRMYKDTIQKPSEIGVDITTQVENALLKGLAVYSKNRYQDMTKLINALYGRGSATTTAALGSSTTSTSIPAAATVAPRRTKKVIVMTPKKEEEPEETPKARRPASKTTSVTQEASDSTAKPKKKSSKDTATETPKKSSSKSKSDAQTQEAPAKPSRSKKSAPEPEPKPEEVKTGFFAGIANFFKRK